MTRTLAALLVLSAPAPALATDLEIAYTEEFLTNGYSNWRSLGLGAAWRLDERALLAVSARELQRFDLHDLDLGASASGPLGDSWVLGGEATASPTHRFTALVSGALHLQYAIGWGLVGSAGVKWARFANEAGASHPVIGRMGVEYYWGAFRVGWTGFLSTVSGAWSASQRATGDFFYGDGGRVGVGLSMGRELESVGGRVVMTDVLGAVVAGRHDVDAAWSLLWEVGVQRQGGLYTRTGATLGIRRRF
jgi:YaiO family outer membrane protein